MKKLIFLLALVSLLSFYIIAEGQSEGVSEEGKVYIFKYANAQSPNHPRSKSMVLFKEQLEKASNGRIKVELFFSGVLGKEAEVLYRIFCLSACSFFF